MGLVVWVKAVELHPLLGLLLDTHAKRCTKLLSCFEESFNSLSNNCVLDIKTLFVPEDSRYV